MEGIVTEKSSWMHFKEELNRRVGEQVRQRWLSTLRFVDLHEGVMRLAVAPEVLTRASGHYRVHIEAAAAQVYGAKSIVIQEEEPGHRRDTSPPVPLQGGPGRFPLFEIVVTVVSQYYGVPSDRFLKRLSPASTVESRAREVALYLFRERSDLNQIGISRQFLLNDVTVSVALKRAKERLGENVQYRETVAELLAQVDSALALQEDKQASP